MKNLFKNLIWLVVLLVACSKEEQNTTDYLYGKGAVVSKVIKTGNFDVIDLRMRADVYLQQGASSEIRLEGQKNLIENLRIQELYGQLSIDEKQDVAFYENFKIYITTSNVKRITTSAFARIQSVDTLKTKNLVLQTSDGGIIDLNTVADNIFLMMGKHNKNSLQLNGSANVMNADIQDCKTLNASNLKAKKAIINLCGYAEVNVSDSLFVEGCGTIYYKGNPVIVSLRSKDRLRIIDANLP